MITKRYIRCPSSFVQHLLMVGDLAWIRPLDSCDVVAWMTFYTWFHWIVDIAWALPPMLPIFLSSLTQSLYQPILKISFSWTSVSDTWTIIDWYQLSSLSLQGGINFLLQWNKLETFNSHRHISIIDWYQLSSHPSNPSEETCRKW